MPNIEPERKNGYHPPLIELQLSPKDRRRARRDLLISLLLPFIHRNFGVNLPGGISQYHEDFAALMRGAIAQAGEDEVEIAPKTGKQTLWWYRPARQDVVFQVAESKVSYLVPESGGNLSDMLYFTYDLKTRDLSCTRQAHWSERKAPVDVPLNEVMDRLHRLALRRGLPTALV